MVKKIIVCSRSQEKTAEAEEVLKKFGIEVVSVENAVDEGTELHLFKNLP